MSLDVYLSGRRVGALRPDERGPDGVAGYGFAYAPELVEEVGIGTPLLSYALPVQAEPFGPMETRAYVEGLLPEGGRRERIARELGLEPGDGYSLIAALGRDCPGAVVFSPEGEAPVAQPGAEPAWLGEDELEGAMTMDGPSSLCDPDDERRMRFALPGKSHKLALVCDEAGERWAWPGPGTPSTHIVEPQLGDAPDLVAEVACRIALREMGLPVAHAELEAIAGHTCLVSKRFDRWGQWPGVERLHQESLFQALGYAPDDRDGRGPGYAESRALLDAIGEANGTETLFVAGYSRFLVGCVDRPHGKCSGLLYTAAGPMLAPFHGLAPVVDEAPAPATLEELVRRDSCLVGLAPIGIECGYDLKSALERAIETMERLYKALDSAAERAYADGWYEHRIDEILQQVLDRLGSLGEEMQILRPPSPPQGG